MLARFVRLFAVPGLVVAGLASQPAAHAGMVTFTAAIGGSALAGQDYSTFDARTLGNGSQTSNNGVNVAFTGGGAFVRGSVPNVNSAPIFSGLNNQYFYPNASTSTAPPLGEDATTYISTGAGSATLRFASGSSTYLGLLWGTIDTFNTLTFNFADGSASQVVSGSDILNRLGVSSGGTTAYVNFTGSAFTSVVAASPTASFEFDNVAISAVPEPSSMALCGIAAVAGLGFSRARRRRVAA